ncbi:sensor histidine kinase [Salinispira pacifica]|nr:HAMP domain-containing sensor histidine kinase [Salinispira pacifica]
MKTRNRQGVSIRQLNIPLIGGYLLISLLLFMMFFGTVRRNAILDRLLFEQEFARVLSMSRIMPMLEGQASLEEINEMSPLEIYGAALYDHEGEVLFGMGDIPPSLMPLEETDTKYQRQNSGSTIIYMRTFTDAPRPPQYLDPFPSLRSRPSDTGEQNGNGGASEDSDRSTPPGFNREGRRQILPATVYLSASMPRSAPGASRIWMLYAILEIILAVLLAALGRMYIKNREYREQIEEQRHLVHLGEAARTLTHEIKNPLSAIGLRMSILKKTTGENTREDLNIIQEEVDRLNDLSSRIREFLKNPAGNPGTIHLQDYLPELIKRMPEHTSFEDNLPEDTACIVSIDESRLRSILENLILNAHEANRSGDNEDMPVKILLEQGKRNYVLRVQDRGNGIDRENRERIFDPFFTTKTRGSGIGLSIARQFAQAAGGSLEYHPRDGGGSEFILTLPSSSREAGSLRKHKGRNVVEQE